MATIRKRGKTYQAQIRLKGVVESKTFFSLLDARDWSFSRELEIKNGQKAFAGSKKLSFLLEEYKKNVTPKKKSARNETNQINRICRSWLVDLRLDDIEPHHIERWSDEQCRFKKTESVRRDLTVLSSAFEYGRKKRKWIRYNPVRDVDKPAKSPSRRRRTSEAEMSRILGALNYTEDDAVKTVQQQMAVAYMLALETAMRQGEIFNLLWRNVDIRKRTALPLNTKNGEDREVPLSSRAIALIDKMQGLHAERVFPANQSSAAALFAKAVRKAKIDSRCRSHQALQT